MIDYATARLTMVDSQLRTNKVTDEKLLDAFLAVPRERFVPPAIHGLAYSDAELPLGGGRTLMEPMVLARMLQSAEIAPDSIVLEIGCGSGYGTAILARLARHVVAIESDRRLAGQARARLAELGATNATVIDAPMTEGYPARAPYDTIIFMGAVQRIPEAILHQLADGGRLVAVVQQPNGIGRATLMTRSGEAIAQRPYFDAAPALLPGFEAEPSFVF